VYENQCIAGTSVYVSWMWPPFSCVDNTHSDLPKGNSVTGTDSTEYLDEEGNQWDVDQESQGQGYVHVCSLQSVWYVIDKSLSCFSFAPPTLALMSSK